MSIKILGTGNENRKPGKTVRTGESIISGIPVILDPSDTTGETIMVHAGTTLPVGLALETNVAPTVTNVLYDDYNRGGLVSYMSGTGVEVEIWNDGRGAPYDTAQTYTIGALVYANAGVVSNQSNGTAIGQVTKVPTSVTDSLRIQLLI